MKKILIIGGLTGGFGGMETVLKKFYALLSQDSQYQVSFYIIGTPRKKHHFSWLQNIPHQFIGKIIPIQFIERKLAVHQLKKQLTLENFSAIIAYNSLGVLIAKAASKNLNINILSWMHFSFNSFSKKHQQRISTANYHLAICDEIKQQMMHLGIPDQNIFTVYNPTSRVQQLISRPKEKTKFLYIGRIQYQDQKNMQELFHALALVSHQNFQLEIIGDGKEEDIMLLKQLAKSLNIEQHIKWHGWQANAWEYIQEQIQTISALVMSSSYEGFPMVLGEAMARGIFCISSNCPTGPADIINHNNGLLYPLGDIPKLASHLNFVCQNELPEQNNIQESIEHLYDDQYIKNIKNILNKLPN